jgi:hypothetical protein
MLVVCVYSGDIEIDQGCDNRDPEDSQHVGRFHTEQYASEWIRPQGGLEKQVEMDYG